MAEENLTLNKVLKKLSTLAGFKDLSPKQIMTKLASSKQASVMNAVKAAKFKGGLATIAGGLLIEGIAKIVASDQTSVSKKGPMRLAGRGKENKNSKDYDYNKAKSTNVTDKEAIQKAVETVVNKKDYPTSAPDTSPRPVSNPTKPTRQDRPKARPSNLYKGGMAKAKPRTGNMDYRMGGMFMKKGNK